jgi:exosortase/archaeosortase family protein
MLRSAAHDVHPHPTSESVVSPASTLAALCTAGFCIAITVLAFRLYESSIWPTDKSTLTAATTIIRLIAGALCVFLVPWHHIAQLPRNTDLRGLVVVAFACAVFLAGKLSADLFVTRFSGVLLIAGLVWTFIGAVQLRGLFVPLMVLSSSIPLPLLVTNRSITPLQMITSDLALNAVRLSGHVGFRNGSALYFRDLALSVLETCGNLQNLGLVVTVSFMVITRYRTRWAYEAVLLALLVPLAAAIDATRILVTVLLSGHSMRNALLLDSWGSPVLFSATVLIVWQLARRGRGQEA